MSSEIDWDGPFGREPDDLPVVVAHTRQRGMGGMEYRVADDPAAQIVRLAGDKATIAVKSYRLGYPDSSLRVGVAELATLARRCAAWRAHRVNWAALTGGWNRRQPCPRRYRPGNWAAVWVTRCESIVKETTYRPVKPLASESIAGMPVKVTLKDGIGQYVGAVVCTEFGRCATMLRGSLALSVRWPRRHEDFGEVAQFLIRRSYSTGTGEKGPLSHLMGDSVELDALGCAVLEEAATETTSIFTG